MVCLYISLHIPNTVIPAKAGILLRIKIPAFAGMTGSAEILSGTRCRGVQVLRHNSDTDPGACLCPYRLQMEESVRFLIT
jgi:hypothetical protein